MTTLHDVLAELYADEESARRIVRDVGLDTTRVSFNAKAVNTWSSIVNEATAQGRLADVIRVVLKEYPAYERLLDTLWSTPMPHAPNSDGFMNPTHNITPLTSESEAAVIARLATQLEYLTVEVKRVSDGLNATRGLNVERIEQGLDDIAFMRGRVITLTYAVAIVTAMTMVLGVAFLMHL